MIYGYFWLIIVNWVGGIICLINSLFFGIYWYFDTFIRDLLDIMNRIDQIWNQTIKKDHTRTLLLFREFLEFNWDIFR